MANDQLTQDPLSHRPLLRILRCWCERHQHPLNLRLHILGIPMSVTGFVLLFTLPWETWYLAPTLFIGGYTLQYAGHRVEGNDMGEWIAIKRLLGLSYVAVPPQRSEFDEQ